MLGVWPAHKPACTSYLQLLNLSRIATPPTHLVRFSCSESSNSDMTVLMATSRKLFSCASCCLAAPGAWDTKA